MNSVKLLAIGACVFALAISGCSSPKKRSTTARPAASGSSDSGAAATPSRDARYEKAVQLVKSGQWQAAEAEMKSLAQAYPGYSGPPTNLGIIYKRTNRKDLAAAAFGKAVALNPKNPVAQTGLGILAAEAGDYTRARAAYRAALAADPKYGVAHLNLGILYDRHLNRPDLALREYKRYQKYGGKDDLKAAVWIAELERRTSSKPANPPRSGT